MGSPQSTSRYLLLLQVWCGFLTLAMVVMAAVLSSVSLTSQDKNNASSTKDVYDTPTGTIYKPFIAEMNSKGPPYSYIQLTMHEKNMWEEDPSLHHCDSCFLALSNNSIRVNNDGLYRFFFHVTFGDIKNVTKRTVSLCRDATDNGSKREKKLIETVYASSRKGSVYADKLVRLQKGDSVSLKIHTLYLFGVETTYWGAHQLL